MDEHRVCSTAKFALVRCVSNGYTCAMSEKDAGMRIRVERKLRDEFLEACREQDRPAAQVIREFMRDYISAKKIARVGQGTSATKPASRTKG